MLDDVCTNQLTGRGKKCFKTRRACERAARNSPIKLFAYACRYCHGWHHTHEANKFKTVTPPSLGTLKRWIANQSKVIAACERRVHKAEQRLAADRQKAEQTRRAAQHEYAIELDAIRKMTDSIRRF
jgi:hypothetical protein